MGHCIPSPAYVPVRGSITKEATVVGVPLCLYYRTKLGELEVVPLLSTVDFQDVPKAM